MRVGKVPASMAFARFVALDPACRERPWVAAVEALSPWEALVLVDDHLRTEDSARREGLAKADARPVAPRPIGTNREQLASQDDEGRLVLHVLAVVRDAVGNPPMSPGVHAVTGGASGE